MVMLRGGDGRYDTGVPEAPALVMDVDEFEVELESGGLERARGGVDMRAFGDSSDGERRELISIVTGWTGGEKEGERERARKRPSVYREMLPEPESVVVMAVVFGGNGYGYGGGSDGGGGGGVMNDGAG